MQRYKLLAESILKNTVEENTDQEELAQAISIIGDICSKSDAAVADTNNILECRTYQSILLPSAQGPDGNLSVSSRTYVSW